MNMFAIQSDNSERPESLDDSGNLSANKTIKTLHSIQDDPYAGTT